jgi:pantetheine-phosphate adenylyltransferase
MKRIAVYPGSFDPVTMGHVDIIRRVSAIFDEVIVLVAQSSQKENLFSAEERKKHIESILLRSPHVTVDIHEGLTVQYLKQKKAQVIIRGLRSVSDFEYEMTMSSINHRLDPDIETMLIFARPEYGHLSSRAVKEIAINGGSLQGLVPDHVRDAIVQKLKK